MHCKRFLFASCLFLGLSSSPLRAEPITQIIVFGDSLSDTGNVYASTLAFSPIPPSPPYYNGRYSNGPVWVERLAQRLGVPPPAPSLLGGSNYAFGGAETGAGFTPTLAFNLGTQVRAYQKDVFRMGSHPPGTGHLFVIWSGANDFFDGQTNPAIPLHNIAANIKTLVQAGAKNFLVADYPDLSKTPFAQFLTPAQRQGLHLLTDAYNTGLKSEILTLHNTLGVSITRLDVSGLFNQILASPDNFGFTNVKDAALYNGVLSGQGYLFWDSVHPTAKGHQLIGDMAFRATTAPEPSALTLLAVGGCISLLGWQRLRPAEVGGV